MSDLELIAACQTIEPIIQSSETGPEQQPVFTSWSTEDIMTGDQETLQFIEGVGRSPASLTETSQLSHISLERDLTASTTSSGGVCLKRRIFNVSDVDELVAPAAKISGESALLATPPATISALLQRCISPTPKNTSPERSIVPRRIQTWGARPPHFNQMWKAPASYKDKWLPIFIENEWYSEDKFREACGDANGIVWYSRV